MASIPKASTLLLKISLLLITAIKIAAADRRSILAELYKQAADQNRPLILVVDNHSKDDGHGHQGHGVSKGSRHDSDDATPVHYIYPRGSLSKSVNHQERNEKKDSKADLLKFYLSRLFSHSHDNRDGLKKKTSRSDDRDDIGNYKYRNNYKDDRDQRDRRDQYKVRDRDTRYNNRPRNVYYKPRESRNKYYDNRPEDRVRYDRDRYDRDRRDRYRLEKDREDRDWVDRYRSEKDRVDGDRVDRYYQDRNKGRDYEKVIDYRDDRDSYQSPSQHRYQQPRDKDRYTDNYGADVLKNLLRYSNDLNCEAKYECKGSCYARARLLRQNGDNCEDLCDEKYECDESKEVKVKNVDKDNGCDGRGNSDESCGDEKTNGNISTRGYTDKDEEDECTNKNRC